ncbi:perilipin-3-like [Carettochelys insculpta]|uniref:perilipin-3-like n=1 Tax=Carettochelys insculpta TaxID=44489 RepID=UPI003EBEAB0E
MASNGKDANMASPEQQQTVLKRVASLPLVNSACDLAAAAYTSTKESHPYVKSLCDLAEKGVTSITNVAVSSPESVPPTPEPQVTETESASEVPAEVEETLQTAEKAVSDTQELASSQQTDVKEAMIRVVDVTKEAVQDGMKATKSAVTDSMSTVAESRMGQLAVSGMEAVLGKSEELLDYYLPMTEEELAELAEPVEGAEMSPAKSQELRSYFVRLGSLSTKLRQRAYRCSLDKMRCVSQSMSEALSQLLQAVGLIEQLKQGETLQDAKEKFHQMWLNWNRKKSEGSEIPDLADSKMESETLAMSRSILQQLQDACQVLVSSIQGLPTSLQDKDLSSGLLTQSQEMVSRAQEYVDELMSYMMQNTPSSWIVGPFVPSGKGSTDSIEPQSQENEAKEAEVTTASI